MQQRWRSDAVLSAVSTRHKIKFSNNFYPDLKRAVLTALIVGSVLTVVNLGDSIWHGSLSFALVLKVCATLLIPFTVSLVTARLTGKSWVPIINQIEEMSRLDLRGLALNRKTMELAPFELSMQNVLTHFRKDFSALRDEAYNMGLESSRLRSNCEDLREVSTKLLEATEENSRTSNSMIIAYVQSSQQIHNLCGTVSKFRENSSNNVALSMDLVERLSLMTQRFEELSQSISTISKLSSHIKGIAFQSKLLAFNASIEAALAADAGAGFSVVAAEVKNLADLSEKYALQINKAVSSIELTNVEARQVFSQLSLSILDVKISSEQLSAEAAEQIRQLLDLEASTQDGQKVSDRLSEQVLKISSETQSIAQRLHHASVSTNLAVESLCGVTTKIRSISSAYVLGTEKTPPEVLSSFLHKVYPYLLEKFAHFIPRRPEIGLSAKAVVAADNYHLLKSIYHSLQKQDLELPDLLWVEGFDFLPSDNIVAIDRISHALAQTYGSCELDHELKDFVNNSICDFVEQKKVLSPSFPYFTLEKIALRLMSMSR